MLIAVNVNIKFTKSVKKSKSDIKGLTKKSCTFSYEQWTERLNAVLRGKYNYYLKAVKAGKKVEEAYERKEKVCHCKVDINIYRILDGYVRQRLRVAFANRGKKSARYRDGMMSTVKYSNKFFCRSNGSGNRNTTNGTRSES